MGRPRKLIYGIGINDADYAVVTYMSYYNETGKRVRKAKWVCPFYIRWINMLTRCYSTKRIKRTPTYIACEVCEEWKTFSSFKTWMESEDWEGKQLDKDLKVIGNKVYSPDTCLFIDQKVNTFVLEANKSRGEYPIGVCYHKLAKKYHARCNNPISRKQEHLGLFDTPEEAHEAWKKRKRELCLEVTDDKMLQELLLRRYE